MAILIAGCKPEPVNTIDVIPCPLEVTAGIGTFDLNKRSVKFVTVDNLAEEEYEIVVTKHRAIVKTSSEQGRKLAKQTLRQITTEDGNGLKCCEIKDSPRFPYRGILIDCARHFYPKEEIEKILDVMAYYRLNRMHWHLTDDHGWRIEIKQYPLLTEVGAFGDIGSQPDWGEDPNLIGEVRLEGYYSQDDIREVVSYADSLGITIVPEIDMPGHMTSALAAYPYLGCTGGPYKVINFVGPRGKGFGKENLCIGKEEVFTFVENVLKEVVELFPSEYIHIGGDECIPERWNNCPNCQKRIQEEGIKGDEQFSEAKYLQNYFTQRVQKILEGYGRKIIGWDEILDGKLGDGATIMSWRGTRGGINAAKRGMDAIMSPSRNCYLDKRQSADDLHEPIAFGKRPLPVDSIYAYEPTAELSEEEARHILGVQGNLWCDVISTSEYLEYMLLPRLAALSEVQWCQMENRDWERFRKALDSHVKFYEDNGYVYAKHLWGIVGLPGHEYVIPATEAVQDTTSETK
ncbi:MAG: beta-N-acetylhexosaminidase [Bacteroidales bacterium]|nr:beta-N-acetylhexosaminidase [Candidatus Cacconaster merdequi]